MIARYNFNDNNNEKIYIYNLKIYLEFRFYLEQERSFNIYKKKITRCARVVNVPQLI